MTIRLNQNYKPAEYKLFSLPVWHCLAVILFIFTDSADQKKIVEPLLLLLVQLF